MKRQRSLFVGLTAFAALLVLGVGQSTYRKTALGQARAAQAARPAVPSFQVDPLWPQPLPNHWIIGSVTGVAVDSRDHVWIVHNGANSMTQNTEMGTGTTPPSAERCCSPAPPVLEFDAAGALVSHWGGENEGYDWPRCVQGLSVDPKGNIWVGGDALETKGNPPRACQFGGGGSSAVPPSEAVAEVIRGSRPAPAAAGGRGGAAGGGRGAAGRGGAGGRGGRGAAAPGPLDAMVLRFMNTGKFLKEIGAAGKMEGPASTTTLNRPTAMDFDAAANEVYVADTGNRRIVVFDMDSGAYKRHWGAYGNKPDMVDLGPYDPGLAVASQFRNVSCVHIAKDGLVYVCDKTADRIQVFQKDGKFVKESLISNETMGGDNGGSVWDLAFSKDPQQSYMYVADGYDKKIFIVQRDTLQVVSAFGQGGRLPGEFVGVGSLAVDSKGNLYSGETFEGKRVQKWILK
jgi:hypothetical protein